MADLLLEIGTEEIPAGFMPPALESLATLGAKLLDDAGIAHGAVKATGTPRRLVLVVREVEETQPRTVREVMGPARKVAFGADGKPTKACQGFAKGQGVRVEDLRVRETPKGEYVVAMREEGGRPTSVILAEALPGLLGAIPFPKSMRWGDQSVRFARPVRWILAIFGGETVPFEWGGLSSGNVSRGHRFMARGSFTVADPEEYFRRAKSAFAIVDHEQRRQTIREALAREAEARKGRVMEDEALLETVNFLVEFPVVACGSFDPSFLDVPPEVLVTSMKSHQKYFPVTGADGKLLPLFLAVLNLRAEDPDVIRKGNERVLSARLSDARFFWREDNREPLAAKAEKLKKVVYQEKLGTSWEKVERFTGTALHLCRTYGLGDPAAVGRAAFLCKADLVTEMVGEFPELQGVMGTYYARQSGEPEEVCLAIRDHYLPRFGGDELPATAAGAAVGLADRMDTICGSFGIGQKPTGSEDPYGLRRQALAMIAVILDRELEVDLDDLAGVTLDRLGSKLDRPADEVRGEVMEFFRGRLQALLVQEGFRPDLVEAVLASGMASLPDVRRRLEDLADFCGQPEFEPFAVAYKRVMNIIPEGFSGKVKEKLLAEESERALYRSFREREAGIRELAADRKYGDVLRALASLRPDVDAFFEGVLVMAEDQDLRNNRLALLSGLAHLFDRVADMRKIA